GGAVLTLALWSLAGLAVVLFVRRTPTSTPEAPTAPAREPALTG
ncbi:ABC transporter permease, partial [Streptomyces sp. SID7499]|nr:ABC transporter permease [Streptomyces sp. SID7499]